MGKTAWGQEFDAKLEAWAEIDRLKQENQYLKEKYDRLKEVHLAAMEMWRLETKNNDSTR